MIHFRSAGPDVVGFVLLMCVFTLPLTSRSAAAEPASLHLGSPEEPQDAAPFKSSKQADAPAEDQMYLLSDDDGHDPRFYWGRHVEESRTTGDWGGLRTDLEENRGLSIDATYIGDYWNNVAGGLNTSDAHIYQGAVDLALTLDTDATGLWEGGTFFIDFQNLHGRSITEEYVGDLQTLSNLDAPAYTQVSEYWYEQRLWDDRVRVKLGKIEVNADFAYLDYGVEFLNSTPGVAPTIPMPTFPDPALGVSVFVEPVEWLYGGAGVYDGFGEGTGSRWGFDTAFHDEDDAFTIYELGVRPEWAIGGESYPGRYYVGGWYHSGDFEEFPTREPYSETEVMGTTVADGNKGVYLGVDQWLFHETPGDDEDEQGLAAFFQYAWAPGAVNEITRVWGGGLRYAGLVPTRDTDVTGLGLFHAKLSDRIRKLEDRHSETVIEMFHRIQITPAIAIQPDLQYIVNPGGAGRDVLVIGARFEVAF